ncbi:protein NUCLEAR FUSION DEFECTIVE 6, mitochondrial-like [Cornus florida]|uniref:protein NUCLEAR FUSION DEFECTIVE 6, mitochondrial-like n=1 Tax=Cornus florida TaxID=4283 RepID=UPI00289EDADA|nr:protein NUCLEAR FUSION DEFECTIVE 6, mitochondrial-like [Cornus florida]
MASNSGRRLLQRSTETVRALLSRSQRAQSTPFNLSGLAPTKPTPSSRLSGQNHSFFFSRLPVELGCAESLMPLHSATASALLTSMLSSKVGQWGTLSEGFATPL